MLLNKLSKKSLQNYYNYNKLKNIFDLNSKYDFDIDNIKQLSIIFNFIIFNKINNLNKLKFYIDFYNLKIDDIIFITKYTSEKNLTKKFMNSITLLIND